MTRKKSANLTAKKLNTEQPEKTNNEKAIEKTEAYLKLNFDFITRFIVCVTLSSIGLSLIKNSADLSNKLNTPYTKRGEIIFTSLVLISYAVFLFWLNSVNYARRFKKNNDGKLKFFFKLIVASILMFWGMTTYFVFLALNH